MSRLACVFNKSSIPMLRYSNLISLVLMLELKTADYLTIPVVGCL